jgi:hypothetical protein
MDFWEKVKRDIQKGIKEGIGIVKEGVTVARAKAEELTEEGKRRLELFKLQTKVEREISELGGKVYELSSGQKNPLHDRNVKTMVGRIKKLETRIAKLEGKGKNISKKKAVRTKKKA